MAMYPSLEHHAVSLGEGITKDQLEKYLFNDKNGKKLKVIIEQAKKTYGNISIMTILDSEISRQPHAWNTYS